MSNPMAVSYVQFGHEVGAEEHRWDEFAAMDELSFRKDRLDAAEAQLDEARTHMDEAIKKHMDRLGSARMAQHLGVTRQTIYNSIKRAN